MLRAAPGDRRRPPTRSGIGRQECAAGKASLRRSKVEDGHMLGINWRISHGPPDKIDILEADVIDRDNESPRRDHDERSLAWVSANGLAQVKHVDGRIPSD